MYEAIPSHLLTPFVSKYERHQYGKTNRSYRHHGTNSSECNDAKHHRRISFTLFPLHLGPALILADTFGSQFFNNLSTTNSLLTTSAKGQNVLNQSCAFD